MQEIAFWRRNITTCQNITTCFLISQCIGFLLSDLDTFVLSFEKQSFVLRFGPVLNDCPTSLVALPPCIVLQEVQWNLACPELMVRLQAHGNLIFCDDVDSLNTER